MKLDIMKMLFFKYQVVIKTWLKKKKLGHTPKKSVKDNQISGAQLECKYTMTMEEHVGRPSGLSDSALATWSDDQNT